MVVVLAVAAVVTMVLKVEQDGDDWWTFVVFGVLMVMDEE